MRRAVRPAFLVVLVVAATGGSTCPAAPPRIYTTPGRAPYAAVAPELRTADVPVIHATDRKAEEGSDAADRKYPYGRDRSLAFGRCHVRFGRDLSWDELVKATRDPKQTVPVTIQRGKTRELGRVPETGY